MRSSEIVDALADRQRRHHGSSTTCRREWSIAVGQTRVDLGVINDRITAFEIKAAGDNLARLPRQVGLYSAVVDRAVVVVERPALVQRALDVVPEWWAVWHTSVDAKVIRFRCVRRGRANPAPVPLAIAQLLWRDEALSVLDLRHLATGLRSSTRWQIWERLAEALPLPELRREVCGAIRARPGW